MQPFGFPFCTFFCFRLLISLHISSQRVVPRTPRGARGHLWDLVCKGEIMLELELTWAFGHLNHSGLANSIFVWACVKLLSFLKLKMKWKLATLVEEKAMRFNGVQGQHRRKLESSRKCRLSCYLFTKHKEPWKTRLIRCNLSHSWIGGLFSSLLFSKEPRGNSCSWGGFTSSPCFLFLVKLLLARLSSCDFLFFFSGFLLLFRRPIFVGKKEMLSFSFLWGIVQRRAEAEV